MGDTDYIGGRSEAIAFTRLAATCRPNSKLPYFWPHFLGEKYETFDYLVELVDAGDRTPFFFVQVKGTRQEYTKREKRLDVKVSTKDVLRMVSFPAPTYVVGVHEIEERAFILSVHGLMNEAISSITTGHELTADTLRHLWEEVREFWHGRDLYFRRFLAAHAAIVPQDFRVSTICCNSARSAELVLNTVSRVTLRST